MNLIEAIKAVPDYRHARGIRHELWLILTIVLLGSCTGYWGYKPLASFTKNYRLRLIKLLDLPPDTRFPSSSTFRNVSATVGHSLTLIGSWLINFSLFSIPYSTALN